MEPFHLEGDKFGARASNNVIRTCMTSTSISQVLTFCGTQLLFTVGGFDASFLTNLCMFMIKITCVAMAKNYVT